jgi:hypothetical protein
MASRNYRKARRTPAKGGVQVLKSYAEGFFPAVDARQVEDRIAGLFSRDNVAEMFGGASSPFRQRLLTIEVMVLCMLHFVLARMPSFLEVIVELQQGRISDLDALDVSPQAFYKRLAVIPHQFFLQVLQSTCRMLKYEQKATRAWVADMAPFAAGIYAIDDTTLDAVARRTAFLKQHPHGDPCTLGGRLACAIDLVTGKFEQVVYDSDAAANEKSHVRPLISALPDKAMLVFDLGYFAFPLFDWITEQGRHFVTRMRSKCTMVVIEVLADRPNYRDRIVWLGKYRADRAAHPVRLIELHLRGQWWGYVTNVMQPSRLNAQQVWALYSQRWTIEMCFAAIKRSLGLAYLRPAKPNAMLTQIWSTLTVYQVLQDLRLEVAAATGWREDDVSWEMLMRRIGWYARDLPQETLREWLCTKAEGLCLKKRGTRKRRLEQLPDEVMAEVMPAPGDPDLAALRVRSARQGDPYPLKSSEDLVNAKVS